MKTLIAVFLLLVSTPAAVAQPDDATVQKAGNSLYYALLKGKLEAEFNAAETSFVARMNAAVKVSGRILKLTISPNCVWIDRVGPLKGTKERVIQLYVVWDPPVSPQTEGELAEAVVELEAQVAYLEVLAVVKKLVVQISEKDADSFRRYRACIRGNGWDNWYLFDRDGSTLEERSNLTP